MKYIFLILFLGLAGCSHSMIMKECKQVQDDDKFVCKTVKPWE